MVDIFRDVCLMLQACSPLQKTDFHLLLPRTIVILRLALFRASRLYTRNSQRIMGCCSSKPVLSAEPNTPPPSSRPLVSAKPAASSGQANQGLGLQVLTQTSLPHNESRTPPPEGLGATPGTTDPSPSSALTSGTYTEPQIINSRAEPDPDTDSKPKSQR